MASCIILGTQITYRLNHKIDMDLNYLNWAHRVTKLARLIVSVHEKERERLPVVVLRADRCGMAIRAEG